MRSTFRCLASLKLAVTLLPILALVLASATVLESRHGAAYARWYIYESRWFVCLLALLGMNIFAAAAIRFPWKRHQIGFVITHCGLLALLAGAVRSFHSGVEGRISLVEGETTQDITLDRCNQISALWAGKPQEPASKFAFEGGPVDWPPGKELNAGEAGGVRLRILNFLQTAHPVEEWIPDESNLSGPAVNFRVRGNDGAVAAESWLVDQQFGDAVSLGPMRLQLQRTEADTMLAEFLQPPKELPEGKGQLVIAYGDQVDRVSVDQHVGQKISLGTTGVTVEIASYLPNAKPDKIGTFVSKDERPKNPMLELRVQLPGEDEPLRQIAFAKDPLLNLDGVYPRVCPVKFRWHHPAVQPPDGVELLQVRDGRLFGRVCAAGAYQSRGEIKSGDKILLNGGFEFEIVQYFPHAKTKVSFAATDPSAGRQEKSEPAVLAEINAGETTQQVWLQRNDPRYGQSQITTKNGSLLLTYGSVRIPLGVSLTLIDFRRDKNPGNAGNAAFSSTVRVVDRPRNVEEVRTIAMNEPLTLGKFNLYQSSFDDAGHGREASTFSVAYDPGRLLKYSGSLMICLGIAIMFYMRAYFFRHRTEMSQSAHSDSLTVVQPMESAA